MSKQEEIRWDLRLGDLGTHIPLDHIPHYDSIMSKLASKVVRKWQLEKR